jgi:hypothetical protein
VLCKATIYGTCCFAEPTGSNGGVKDPADRLSHHDEMASAIGGRVACLYLHKRQHGGEEAS